MKDSARKNKDKKVIAKKPLTNLYEMNSSCWCGDLSWLSSKGFLCYLHVHGLSIFYKT